MEVWRAIKDVILDQHPDTGDRVLIFRNTLGIQETSTIVSFNGIGFSVDDLQNNPGFELIDIPDDWHDGVDSEIIHLKSQDAKINFSISPYLAFVISGVINDHLNGAGKNGRHAEQLRILKEDLMEKIQLPTSLKILSLYENYTDKI